MHYCARAGNTDILMEIVKDLGPNRTQSAVNKQAKVTHDNERSQQTRASAKSFQRGDKHMFSDQKGKR